MFRHNAGAGVIAGGLLGAALLCAIQTAHAQSDEKESTSQRRMRFEIAAGEVSKALNVFSEISGVQLVYPSNLASGMTTRGISGEYTAMDALAALLADTGLEARFTGAMTATVIRVTREPSRTLGPVRVEGVQSAGANAGINGSTDATATEGTRSYTTSAASIGSKSPQSIKDTPQTVSVITRQRMDDQNLTSLSDVMKQTTGITTLGGGTNPLDAYSRAFAVTRVQIDGSAPLATGSFLTYQNLFEMAQYDHVEVLRGADGLFSGYGEPGATINLVRKRPLPQLQLNAEASVGSWNKYRLVADATGPIAFDDRLRARFIATYQDQDYFFEVAESTLETQALTFEADLTSSTLLSVGANALKRDSVPLATGWPRYINGADLHLPRDLCACVAWGYYDSESFDVFVRAEQRLGEKWKMDVKVTRTDQQTDLKHATLYGAVGMNGGGTSLSAVREHTSSVQTVGDATLTGEFELFGERQRVALGANYQDVDASDYEYYIFTGVSGISIPDVFSFDPLDFPEPLTSYRRYFQPARGQKQWGAYARLDLTLWDRWHFPLGVRWSGYEYEQLQVSYSSTGTPRAPTLIRYKGHEFEPSQFAVIYDIAPWLSAYGSYASINKSQADMLTASGDALDPLTGGNLELGLKAQSADGRLNASIDVYRMEQKNFSRPDPRVPRVTYPGNVSCCFLVESDQSRVSQGVDLEVAGRVLPTLEMSVGYTYNENSSEGRGFGAEDGNSFHSQTPKHLLKVWSTLRPTGAWRRLELSLGINAQTETYVVGTACTASVVSPVTGFQSCLPGASVPYSFTESARAIVSSAARYRISDRWWVALNVENVMDRRYYENVGSATGYNYYGAPRSFELSVKGSF